MEVRKIKMEDVFEVERPTLGDSVPITIFRLIRLIALPKLIGDKSDEQMYEAGKEIGVAIAKDLSSAEELLETVKVLKIGVAKVLESTEDKVVVQVDECVSCAGIPNVGKFICNFEGGVIVGALEKILNKNIFVTKQTKCWANGDETCVFDCLFKES